ncbi:MAG: type II toxin-antitoxin system HicB family antitoxin [Clostridiales bacterium]|nr:type II toxin-antitoxin system HicB family antitoxin [Clostridiales bacterium]
MNKPNDVLEYKGYHTRIEFDSVSKVLHGKIEGINDLVTFESDSVSEIESEFQKAVDDYLAFCEDIGQSPDKEYKGTFNIRITPELHKKLVEISFINNESLNNTVEKAIDFYVHSEGIRMSMINAKLPAAKIPADKS